MLASFDVYSVWGGGIYEDESFYQACDEVGVMVWQDFMFGCGNYPTWPEILESIEKEAEYNLRRLRHHPSIVIWVGNNEDYQVQEQQGLTYNYADKDPESWLKTDFPARYIYEHLLPKAVQKIIPSAYYHPGSPWGDGKITSDPTVGDMHQWNGRYRSVTIRCCQLIESTSMARYTGEIPNLRYSWRPL
jgi:beta-mannosidase